MCSAILAREERGVGPVFTQPGAWTALSQGKVNSSATVLCDCRTKGAISRRRDLFPMFPAIRAAIGTFAARGDDKSFAFRARKNLVNIRVAEPSIDLTPMPSLIVTHEHSSDF